jgi:hypothetical protein
MQNGTERRKKRLGAALSALVMGGFLLVVTLCMLWDYFGFGNQGSVAETVVIVLCAVMFFGVIGGILLALSQRWKEIERGEEDEARKY